MLTVSLMGGLGNQLFQIAAGSSIAKSQGRELWLPDTPPTHHSTARYFDTILRHWKDRVRELGPSKDHYEPSYAVQEWSLPSEPVRLIGYFQQYRYISPAFPSTLAFPPVPILEGAFLHIRGGDYVNHPLHDVKLDAYYKRAIQIFPPTAIFYVFTNDREYAKTMPWLSSIDHVFLEEDDEVRALALMAQCRAGGICANSTFSWWGAYLNQLGGLRVLPSNWATDPDFPTEGYFFPGCTVCQV